jgi:hypothetical protein
MSMKNSSIVYHFVLHLNGVLCRIWKGARWTLIGTRFNTAELFADGIEMSEWWEIK